MIEKDLFYGLGMYAYGVKQPNRKVYAKVYSIFQDIAKRLDIEFTHTGMEGSTVSTEKYITIKRTKKLQQMIDIGFDGIDGFTLLSVPKGSDAPTYDLTVKMRLGYDRVQEEIGVQILFSSSYLLGKDYAFFEELSREIASILPFDSGLVYSHENKMVVECYLVGCGTNGMPDKLDKALDREFEADTETRKTRIRMLHNFNILNKHQLSHESSGLSLGAYLKSTLSEDKYHKLEGSDLYACYLSDSEISDIETKYPNALI